MKWSVQGKILYLSIVHSETKDKPKFPFLVWARYFSSTLFYLLRLPLIQLFLSANYLTRIKFLLSPSPSLNFNIWRKKFLLKILFNAERIDHWPILHLLRSFWSVCLFVWPFHFSFITLIGQVFSRLYYYYYFVQYLPDDLVAVDWLIGWLGRMYWLRNELNFFQRWLLFALEWKTGKQFFSLHCISSPLTPPSPHQFPPGPSSPVII